MAAVSDGLYSAQLMAFFTCFLCSNMVDEILRQCPQCLQSVRTYRDSDLTPLRAEFPLWASLLQRRNPPVVPTTTGKDRCVRCPWPALAELYCAVCLEVHLSRHARCPACIAKVIRLRGIAAAEYAATPRRLRMWLRACLHAEPRADGWVLPQAPC